MIAESGVDRFEIAASRTNAKGDNVSDAKMSGLVSDALANVTARKGSFGIIGLCSRGLTPELSRAAKRRRLERIVRGRTPAIPHDEKHGAENDEWPNAEPQNVLGVTR